MKLVTAALGKVLSNIKFDEGKFDEKYIPNKRYLVLLGKDCLIKQKNEEFNPKFFSIEISGDIENLIIEYIRKFDYIVFGTESRFSYIDYNYFYSKADSINMNRFLFYIMFNICLEVLDIININNKDVPLYYLNVKKIYTEESLIYLKKVLIMLNLIPNFREYEKDYFSLAYEDEPIEKYATYNPYKEDKNFLAGLNF